MAKTSTLFRTSGLLLVALALLVLSAFLILSGTNPVLAGNGGDVTGPGCISYVPVVGDTRIKITLRDTESGLASITANAHKNVNLPFVVPAFDPGYTFGVTGTIEVTDPGANARIGVLATDVAGNSTSCAGNYFAPAP